VQLPLFSSEHFSYFALSRTIFGITTFCSIFLNLKLSGSPENIIETTFKEINIQGKYHYKICIPNPCGPPPYRGVRPSLTSDDAFDANITTYN